MYGMNTHRFWKRMTPFLPLAIRFTNFKYLRPRQALIRQNMPFTFVVDDVTRRCRWIVFTEWRISKISRDYVTEKKRAIYTEPRGYTYAQTQNLSYVM